jgi:hypothetical protein
MLNETVKTRKQRLAKRIGRKARKRLRVIDDERLKQEAVELVNREYCRYRQRYGYTRTPSWFLYAYRSLVVCIVRLRRQTVDRDDLELRRCELVAMVDKKAIRILDLKGFYYHRRGEEAGEKLRQKRSNATADRDLWESLQKVFSRPQEQPPVKLEKRPDLKPLPGGKAAQVLALPPPEPEPEASVVCSWCLREIGKKKGMEGVTHGCCEACKEKVLGELNEHGVYSGAEVK